MENIPKENNRNVCRGKTAEGWVYGNYVKASKKHGYIIGGFWNPKYIESEDISHADCVCHKVNNASVGMLTEVPDIKGRNIYEGDILRRNNNDKDLVEICLGEFIVYSVEEEVPIETVYGFYQKVITTDALSAVEPFCLPLALNKDWVKLSQLEIIGNKTDNPELMKGNESCQ